MFFYHQQTYMLLGIFAWGSIFFFMYNADMTSYGSWLGHPIADGLQCCAAHACVVVWRLSALTYRCGLEKYMTNVVFREEHGAAPQPYFAVQVFANTSCVFRLTNTIIWMHLVAAMSLQYMITAYATDMAATFIYVDLALRFKDTWIRTEAIPASAAPFAEAAAPLLP